MNIHLINVTNTGTATKACPCLHFYGQWLPQMGFLPDMLVKAVPGPGGMDFVLHDGYITSFRELDSSARKQGGRLIKVFDTDKSNSTSLAIKGRYINNAGLDIGDALIARYNYGLIQARKLPATAKAVLRISVRGQPGRPRPKAQLAGDWLPGSGFTPNTPVVAISEPGRVTFEIVERLSDYCFSAQNKIKLIQ